MNILIIGATSAIAQAAAREWATRGESFVLVARDRVKLDTIRDDLIARGAGEVVILRENFLEHGASGPLCSKLEDLQLDLDVLFVACGMLPDAERAALDMEYLENTLRVNFIGILPYLEWAGRKFAQQRSGTIAVISSVAADRGRKGNYQYGAAKAGLDTYLSGLRNLLSKEGVHVLTIRPGFVDTPMTRSMKKGLLFSSPDRVGSDIVRAVARRSEILYSPWYWRWIMFVICAIPEKLFKRMTI